MERFNVYVPNVFAETIEEETPHVAARVAMCQNNLQYASEITVIGKGESITYHTASVDARGFTYQYRTKREYVELRELWMLEVEVDFTKIDKSLFYDLLFSSELSACMIKPFHISYQLFFFTEQEAHISKGKLEFHYAITVAQPKLVWSAREEKL
jgi:hypothetical protein